MANYIEVITIFATSNNEGQSYMKGSVAYQEILTSQVLGGTAGGHLVIVGYDEIFKNKARCICDFNSWKEALFGEMRFRKENKPYKPSEFTVHTYNTINQIASDVCNLLNER